ncbi:MAG: ATP-binding protein [Symploca sp. SIO2D2]|nr:ATP-binding protein [Symploca sp. SIO2D2]
MDSEAAFAFIYSLLKNSDINLQDSHKAVILGIWSDKTYAEISYSPGNNWTEVHLRDIGSKLFQEIQKISGISDKKIQKSNFKTTIEQLYQQQQSKQARCLFHSDYPTISCDQIITNPFLPLTGAVDDPELFFDRQSEAREIFALLNSGSSVALIGERAIGKSSLLKAICREAPTQLLSPRQPIYLNLQQLENEDEFYTALCEEVGIPKCRGYFLKKELRKQKHRLLLAIDEVEKMTWDGFTREIRTQLRGLAEGIKAPLRLILAARDPLDSLFPDSHTPGMTSPLAGICHQVNLGSWDEATIRAFITSRLQFPRLKPLPQPVKFTEEKIVHLITASGGHPQKLMQLCYESYQRQQALGNDNDCRGKAFE